MIQLHAQCKFCDALFYFDVPEDASKELVLFTFKASLDKHLLEHVEEIMEITHEKH